MTHLFDRINITTAYVLDQDEALDFYCGTLGFEVRDDVDLGFMRWLTIALPGQAHQVLLELPGPPVHDEQTAAQVRELVTKGALGAPMFLTTEDCRATYRRMVDAGVEITQEPVEQPYGVDFGMRDPFGNQLRVAQLFAEQAEVTDEVKERWAGNAPVEA